MIDEDGSYSVLKFLPYNGQKCLCFGHMTYCCKEDMDKEPEWHEVTFNFNISTYKLKENFPEDIEDSVLDYYDVHESWDIGSEFCDGHVIGVTKWKSI